MKEIQASKNPLIKELRKLHQKKHREEQGRYLLEGFHLVEEAARWGETLELILVTQRGLREWGSWLARQGEESLYQVSDEVMRSLSDLPTPQGIMAVVSKKTQIITDFSGRWLPVGSGPRSRQCRDDGADCRCCRVCRCGFGNRLCGSLQYQSLAEYAGE